MVLEAGQTERETQEVDENVQYQEEEEEEGGTKASDWRPLQRERGVEGEKATAEDLIVLSNQRPSEVNELTVQDDITRAEQLQTLQKVDQGADATFSYLPLVHHIVSPSFFSLSQSYGSLIIKDF